MGYSQPIKNRQKERLEVLSLMAYGTSGNIANALYYLDSVGLRDVILPFLLIFTLLFAVLEKVNLFPADGGRKYNIIISLTIALLVIIPHVTGQYKSVDVVEVINNALPQIALLIVVIIMVLILLGIVGGKTEVKDSPLLGIIGIGALLILIFVFIQSISNDNAVFNIPVLGFLQDTAFQSLLMVLLVFGLIIWFITREPNTSKKEGAFETFQKLFGGSKK